MRRRLSLVVAATVLALVCGRASAWHGPGHELASRTAAAALPKDMPAFFAAGVDVIAHASVDPDLFTKPIAPTTAAAGG